MTCFRPLPAREPPLPGESLASLVRRQALAMGYEGVQRIRALLPRSDRSPAFNHLGPGPVLERLSDLLCQSEATLRQATSHRFANELVLVARDAPRPGVCDSKTLLRFFQSPGSPHCFVCLQAEIPYERLLWTFRPLPVCRDHGCFLVVRCPDCRQPLSTGRLNLRVCRCGVDLSHGHVERIPPAVRPLIEAVHEWLEKRQSPLPGLSIAAGFWWTERLAAAIGRTPAWLTVVRERLTLPQSIPTEYVAWLAAAEILIDGSPRLGQFLDVFQTVTRHAHAATGVSRSFGLLLREARHLEQQGYPGPAEALRDYLLPRYTQGHLNAKVCLFQAEHRLRVAQRPWLTQTEAARLLHLRHGTVAALVKRGVLAGRVASAGTQGRSLGLVSRASVEALRQELESAVTVPEAARQLGLGRGRLFELIASGLLPRAVRTSRGWLIPSGSIHSLLEHYIRLPPCSGRRADCLSLREACRRFGRSGLTLVRLLTAVAEHRIAARRDPQVPNLSGLSLHSADLASLLPAVREEQRTIQGYALSQLAGRLIPGRPLKDVVLRKWIEAGLLNAEKVGRAWCIGTDEVSRFRATFCLADEACRILGVHRATLSRWEAEGRVTAVYGRRTRVGAGASVFCRSEIEALRAELAVSPAA